jgi:transglutaminase-like putative cysteine protease
MAQSDSGKWYDYGMQTFDMLDFTTAVTPKEKTNTYHTNPQYYFNRVNDIVNTTDPLVRNTAVSNAREHPGKYNAYQLCSLFDYVSNSVEYVSDPHDSDYWATPAETITTGAGDCEDYAILMAALVEAIGGSARIYLTDDHAFAAAYIGESNATDKTIEAISEYYNYAPVYYVTDIYGSWIMLDASSGMYAGDLPAGAAPVSGGWIFLNQTNVTVVDIASD